MLWLKVGAWGAPKLYIKDGCSHCEITHLTVNNVELFSQKKECITHSFITPQRK